MQLSGQAFSAEAACVIKHLMDAHYGICRAIEHLRLVENFLTELGTQTTDYWLLMNDCAAAVSGWRINA